MPRNNHIHVRGEVALRPYFDLVPNRKTGDRIPFFKVLLDCPRDDTQPRDERHTAVRIRVVAYGKLAEALRGKVKPGDWLVVTSWVRIRKREEGENGAAQTLAEIIALEVDHFMKPFVPGSELMERIERLAEGHGETTRELLTRLIAFGVRRRWPKTPETTLRWRGRLTIAQPSGYLRASTNQLCMIFRCSNLSSTIRLGRPCRSGCSWIWP